MSVHDWKESAKPTSLRERKAFYIALAIAGVVVFILLVVALFGL
jgi:hypothetical protein